MKKKEIIPIQTPQMNKSVDDACADAVERVLIAFPDILDKMIENAKKGSLPHAKFLFDWARLEPAYLDDDEKTSEKSSPSLAQYLIDRLREGAVETNTAHATKVL